MSTRFKSFSPIDYLLLGEILNSAGFFSIRSYSSRPIFAQAVLASTVSFNVVGGNPSRIISFSVLNTFFIIYANLSLERLDLWKLEPTILELRFFLVPNISPYDP